MTVEDFEDAFRENADEQDRRSGEQLMTRETFVATTVFLTNSLQYEIDRLRRENVQLGADLANACHIIKTKLKD